MSALARRGRAESVPQPASNANTIKPLEPRNRFVIQATLSSPSPQNGQISAAVEAPPERAPQTTGNAPTFFRCG